MSGKKKAQKAAAEAEALRLVEAARIAEQKALLRSARSRVAGYKSAASMTPEARTERAKKAGRASAAKREAERARLRALEGLPAPVKRGDRVPRVSMAELGDFLEQFDAEHPGEQFTYEQRRSGATILFKRWMAEQAVRRLTDSES